MNDTPTYSTWERQPLVDEATRMYLLLQEKQHEIEALKLDNKARREAYRQLVLEISK